jgi:LacI family transcriptional regulator
MARKKAARFVHVALVLPTEFAYARGVLRGIIAATRQRNMYAQSPSATGRPWLFRVYRGVSGHSSKFLAKWFGDWEPDGVIAQIYDDRLAKVYRQTGKPVVELFESRAQSEFPRILPDDVATGEMAARHFIERGFRHFAFFGASWMFWSRERETGFRGEIEKTFHARAKLAGVADARGGFTFASYGGAAAAFARSQQRRAAAMGEWLTSLPRPLALFVANDLWGSELIQAAREAGLRIPDDIAILGVDNEELLCEISHPPLSSIRIGAERIGQVAVDVLEQLLGGKPGRFHSPRIPPMEVVTRQSTDVLAVDDAEVAAALRDIRARAVEGLSVKELLNAIPVNRRTLERRFISVLGHTPLDEIRRVRLERAKALLQTDLPIYDIAVRSGFATPEYLATSFLQATGMTPTAYRRQFSPRTRWQHFPPALGDERE